MEGFYHAVSSAEGSRAPSFATTAVGSLLKTANKTAGARHDGESRSLLTNNVNHVEAGQNGRSKSGSGQENNLGIFGKGARRTDNSRLVTILLTVNYMIGSGILNTSQMVLRSGVAATTVLYIIACATLWLGGTILVLSAEASCQGGHGSIEELDYTVLAGRMLGRHGPAVVDLSIVILNFGANCSYIIIVGGLASSMLEEWSTSFLTPEAVDVAIEWWNSFYFVTPVMVLFFVLPPCLVRHYSNLRWLAVYSLFTISAVVALVVIGSPSYAADERAMAFGGSELDVQPLLWWNWTGAFSKLGSVVFALNSGAVVFHSYSAMGERTESEWKIALGVSVLTGGLICYVTGLAGYLAFREATEGDILDNFSGPVAAFFKILVLVHLILYIPSEAIILRHNLYSLMGHEVMDASFLSVSVVTLGLLTLMVVVVSLLMLAGIAQGDLFGYVLDLFGGVTGCILNFVLPAMIYLAATKDVALDGSASGGRNVRAYRIGSRVLLVFGLAMMVLVPAAVVLSVLEK